MKYAKSIALSTIATVILYVFNACNFFNTPVDDIKLPEFSPYLTLISFLDADADTTFIFLAQSTPEEALPAKGGDFSVFNQLGCVQGADVTLTDLTTGQSAKASNDYTPGATTYTGLYMVPHVELPIVVGHEYEIRAVYKNIQPASARCRCAPLSEASFDCQAIGRKALVTIHNVDSQDRYFFIHVEQKVREGMSTVSESTVNAETLANGSIFFTLGEQFGDMMSGSTNQSLTLDTCFVYEFDHNAYKYFHKVELYQNADYGIFSKPVYLFSNVEGGQGIFATRRAVKRSK